VESCNALLLIWILGLARDIPFGFWQRFILIHITTFLGLFFHLASLAARPILLGALVASFWIRLEVIDELAVAVCVCGFAIGVEVS
jgi:hypothetical protein